MSGLGGSSGAGAGGAGGSAGGFFANLKHKFTETVDKLAASGSPVDPAELALARRIEAATAPSLPGPDWGANFELVDTINNDPQGCCDKVYRIIRGRLLTSSIPTQLLALNLLETCVKNCVPFFFQQLIYSELWQEIARAGEPFRQWDPEVRDRALALVEDFARGLPMPAYKEAYESMLDRGVDFPVRPAAATAAGDGGDGGAPYYTPPPVPAASVAAAQGISPEDRAAIAAAVADLEAQAASQAAQEAALAPPGMPAPGHVPALMGPAVLMGAPIRPPGYHPPPGYAPPHQAAVQPPMVAGASPIDPQHPAHGAGGSAGGGLPASREEVEQSLRVSRNSAELLAEMLGPLKAGGDPAALQEAFVSDLVDQCIRYKSLLAELIPRLTEEDLISGALAANDELARVLQDYEDLAKGAAQPSSSGGAGGGAPGGAPGSSGGAAGASSSGAGAGTAFTLLGDDEDEGELSLASSRASRGGAAPPAPPAPAAAAAAAAAPAADDLISFGGGSGPAGAAAAQPGVVQTGSEDLVAKMDALLLAQSSSGGAPPAQPQ